MLSVYVSVLMLFITSVCMRKKKKSELIDSGVLFILVVVSTKGGLFWFVCCLEGGELNSRNLR